MKNKLYLFFSILFCIATLFMGVGYASINSVSLNVSGEMIAQVQNGIFITEVKYNEKLSNNVLVTDSRINSSHQTNLDSSIVLTNNADSQITYDIIIYNSNDLAYVFDGVEHTIGENTYSNENITYKLTNLNVGDIVNSKDDINFSITFYYKDSSNISDVELKTLLNFKFSIASYVVDTFDYTGNYETFFVPHNGIYKIELWGAQGGGDDVYPGGKGSYVSGNIYLTSNDELYIYVGEFGINENPVFNNGGTTDYTVYHEDEGYGYAGGGATDLRISSGLWNNFDSLKSRIMVAAGGGGTETYYSIHLGGAGGGLIGYDGEKNDGEFGETPTGGTQILGGKNGMGTHVITDVTNGFGIVYLDILKWVAKGGSGYYAGGNGPHGDGTVGSGAGGSSFISGHSGCDAITETSTENNIIHTGQSIHYSGYQFTDTVMIDGEGYNWTTERGSLTGMPTHDGAGSMIGNSGNGYAKITFVKEL